MTPEQYERWKDFALRMARTCFRRHRNPSAKWIEEAVLDFIDGIDSKDIQCIHDWDHSRPYPVGSPHHRAIRTYRCGCGYRGEGYSEGYDKPKPDCINCNGTGTATEFARPSGVGDMMSDWEVGWGDGYVLRNADMPERTRRRIESLERRDKEEEADAVRREWEDRYCDPVQCCVRAALDCASAPSAGVMGFTAGDLRRMYPEGVPDWVKGEPNWETIGIKAVVPGVGFVPDPKGDAKAFDELPDEAEVWL